MFRAVTWNSGQTYWMLIPLAGVETMRGGPPVELGQSMITIALQGWASPGSLASSQMRTGRTARKCATADRPSGPG